MADAVDATTPPVPFDAWLASHRHGRATTEWADALADMLEAVLAHRKKGTMTITLEVQPKGATVVVVDSVKLKLPEGERESAVYYVDSTGSLVREDPHQMRLEYGLDGAGNEQLLKIDPGTGEVIGRADTEPPAES